jgi:hypothetical protein
MRRNMDAFIAAVEDARHRLIRQEGQNVSVREIIRRAGYSESERAGIAYHLNKARKWPKGHKVPPELVARLAAVLPISHDDLTRAAQIAAGYTMEVVSGSDLPSAYARFLGAPDVHDGEKQAVTARLLQIIAEETSRNAPSNH